MEQARFSAKRPRSPNTPPIRHRDLQYSLQDKEPGCLIGLSSQFCIKPKGLASPFPDNQCDDPLLFIIQFTIFFYLLEHLWPPKPHKLNSLSTHFYLHWIPILMGVLPCSKGFLMNPRPCTLALHSRGQSPPVLSSPIKLTLLYWPLRILQIDSSLKCYIVAVNTHRCISAQPAETGVH